MDKASFDGLARRLSTEQSRRSALRIAGAGIVAGLVPGLLLEAESAAADLGAQTCSAVGTPCGQRYRRKGPNGKRRQQPACKKCCSKYTYRQRNGQRRCACIPDLQKCRRPDQCCSGVCRKIDNCGCEEEGVPGGLPSGKVCIPGFLLPFSSD